MSGDESSRVHRLAAGYVITNVIPPHEPPKGHNTNQGGYLNVCAAFARRIQPLQHGRHPQLLLPLVIPSLGNQSPDPSSTRGPSAMSCCAGSAHMSWPLPILFETGSVRVASAPCAAARTRTTRAISPLRAASSLVALISAGAPVLSMLRDPPSIDDQGGLSAKAPLCTESEVASVEPCAEFVNSTAPQEHRVCSFLNRKGVSRTGKSARAQHPPKWTARRVPSPSQRCTVLPVRTSPQPSPSRRCTIFFPFLKSIQNLRTQRVAWA
jgi:hypothetical protein